MPGLFTHPVTMAAGAALVSTPIIIHLINRMRFRRVKWAAMEFLLKAQKRTRRKMILEQLLLLLLRCLIVFLVGLLVARYTGFDQKTEEPTRSTAHAIVLDDTPSMADFRVENGVESDAFKQAKAAITDRILPSALRSGAPQSVDLLRLTELSAARSYAPLSKDKIAEIKKDLDPVRPGAVRVSLARGVAAARERLRALKEKDKDSDLVIHVVSDFRDIDWNAEGAELRKELEGCAADKIKVQLLDTALPLRSRTDAQQAAAGGRPLASENLGIVELRPLAKVTARDQPVDFEIRVRNFGSVDAESVRIDFYRNGEANAIKSEVIPRVPKGDEARVVFPVIFPASAKGPPPLERFGLVTARITGPSGQEEVGGLQADNVRHAVIEVEERLSVLVVQGRPELGNDRPEGDAFYLKAALEDAVQGNRTVDGTIATLESADHDLKQYACIFLANVPELSQAAARRLAEYVQQGGGLGIFLGPDVKAESYNQVLYDAGNGPFPFELDALRFQELERKLDAAVAREKKQADARRGADERTSDDYQFPFRGVYARHAASLDHPAIAGLYAYRQVPGEREKPISSFFQFIRSRRCWPVERFGNWINNPKVQELLALGNAGEMKDYEEEVKRLTDDLRAVADQPKFEKVRERVQKLATDIRTLAAKDDPLFALSAALDVLLQDERETGDDRDANLKAFWSAEDRAVQRLYESFKDLRDRVKFGPPLYVAKDYGAGRVLVMTAFTGARMAEEPRGSGRFRATEPRWTDWPGNPSWAPFVFHMYKYLSSGRPPEGLVLGGTFSMPYKAGQFREEGDAKNPVVKVERSFLALNPDPRNPAANIDITPAQPRQGVNATPKDGLLSFSLADMTEPGVYALTFYRPATEKQPEGKETVPLVVSMDVRKEGDLRRAADDEITRGAGGAELRYLEDFRGLEGVAPKTEDFSTRTWIYALIFLVLVAEQAMAVRVSHHARPDDLDAHAPTAAATYSRGHAPPPPMELEAEPREPAGAVTE